MAQNVPPIEWTENALVLREFVSYLVRLRRNGCGFAAGTIERLAWSSSFIARGLVGVDDKVRRIAPRTCSR